MVGDELGSAVMGQQRKEQWSEHTASSVERFGRYANWSGSSVLGRLVLMFCVTGLSKHFIMIGVSAIGQ